MPPLYTPKAAAELLGISVSAVRLYTNTYTKHLSTEATGSPRRLTAGDLRFIAYVVSKTSTGQPHERVLAHLATEEGKEEFDAFEWDAPEGEQANTALVPAAALQAAQALMLDAQRREQESLQRERELQEQINQLLRELGHKEGELEALRASKPKGFWARLLGRGE